MICLQAQIHVPVPLILCISHGKIKIGAVIPLFVIFSLFPFQLYLLSVNVLPPNLELFSFLALVEDTAREVQAVVGRAEQEVSVEQIIDVFLRKRETDETFLCGSAIVQRWPRLKM